MRLAGSFLLLALLNPTVVFAQTNNQNYEDALAAFYQQKYNEAYIHLKNALQKNPNNVTAKLLYGKLLLETHNYDQAIDTFKACLELGADPNLVVVSLSYAYQFNREPEKIINLANDWRLTAQNKLDWQKLKASALLSLKQYVRADELYQELLIDYPDNVGLLNDYALLKIAREQISNAQQLIARAQKIKPNNASSWYLLGRIAQTENQPEKALIAFEKSYQVSSVDPVIVRALISAYIQNGQVQDAKPLLEKVLETSPNDPNAMLLKISLLRAEGKYKQAVPLETDLINKLSLLPSQQFDELPELKLVSGVVSYGQGDFEAAAKSLQNYLRGNPNDLTAISLMANTFIQLEQTNSAMKLLSQHESVLIHDIAKATHLAELYLSQKVYHKAEYWIEQLTQTYPDNASVKLLAAKLAIARGKSEQANLILTSMQVPTGGYQAHSELYASAILQLQNHDYSQSLSTIQKLLEGSPDNIDYLILQAANLIKLKQYKRAQASLVKVLKLEPEHFSAQFNQASILYQIGQYQQAENILQKLLALQPEQQQSQFLMALNLVALNKTGDAISQLESLVLIQSHPIAALNLLVDLYVQQQNFDKAFSRVKQLEQLKPLDYEVIIKKVGVLLVQQKQPEAREQLRILVGMSLSSAKKQFEIAKLQIAAGDLNYAQKSFTRAIDLDPDKLIFKLELARLYLDTRQLDEAKLLIAHLAKQYSSDENVSLLQADLKWEQQDTEAAFALYQEAVELNNNFLQPLVKLYQLAQMPNFVEPFERLMQNLIAKDSQNVVKRKLFADFYLNHQQPEKAKSHYEFILELNTGFQQASVLNNLAIIYVETNLDKALALANRSLEVEPKNPYSLDTKGWILVKQNKLQSGLELLREAYTVNSANPSNLYHIGFTLIQLERQAEAKQYLKQALNLNVEFEEKESTVNLLQ